MVKTLAEILDADKVKYNNMNIQNSFDIIKREGKLEAIEHFYALAHLDDYELRKELVEIAIFIRGRIDQEEEGSEVQYKLKCHIEYWYELTDTLKKVQIIGVSKKQ